MLRPFRVFILIILSFIAYQLHASDGRVTARENLYIDLNRVARDNSGSESRARLVSEAYSRDFGDVDVLDLEKIELRDLRVMFMAAALVDFYDTTSKHLSDMRRVLGELERRHEASSGEIDSFYSALFQGRRFDEMMSFYARHAKTVLQVPIRLRGTMVADLRHVTLDVKSPDVVSLQKVDLGIGRQVLVVAHPLCHFTVNAVAAIESDPSLKQVFVKHSVWIAPPDRNMDLSPFQSWNSAHAGTPMSIAFGRPEWPEVRIWQTPTFIFLKDGKVVGEVIGWPKEGNLESLRRELSNLRLEAG